MLLENEVVVVGYQESIAINPRKMLSLATSPLSIQWEKRKRLMSDSVAQISGDVFPTYLLILITDASPRLTKKWPDEIASSRRGCLGY